MRSSRLVFMLVLLASPAFADEAPSAPSLPANCDTFESDVTNEMALLQTTPTPVSAGNGSAVVRIEPGVFYRATLHPQAEVKLAAPAGKPMLDDDAMAGLLAFRVPADGTYRVAITSGHWIDVVDNGKLVVSPGFQGRRGCPLVQKIVEFNLPAGRDLFLQFTGGSATDSGVLITPAPTTP